MSSEVGEVPKLRHEHGGTEYVVPGIIPFVAPYLFYTRMIPPKALF